MMNHEERILLVVRENSENEYPECLSEWDFCDVFEDPNIRNCDVCGHRIRICVSIQNKNTKKKLIIGTDCAEIILTGIQLQKLGAEHRRYNKYQKKLKIALDLDRIGVKSGRSSIHGEPLSNVEVIKREYPEYRERGLVQSSSNFR